MFSLEGINFGVNNLKYEKYILTCCMFYTKSEILFSNSYLHVMLGKSFTKNLVDKISSMNASVINHI
ncbi:hypothetical protein IK5_05879 [Bacillus cereus VD154]|uniref:Uncharacterized protein n=1 Tax=Bacillus cereus VD154 TaxID=1053238 RepID=A0A9W5NZE6_BACCE|nr:hypothetical protein IK5_05879 [Bacillus cereus VD154]